MPLIAYDKYATAVEGLGLTELQTEALYELAKTHYNEGARDWLVTEGNLDSRVGALQGELRQIDSLLREIASGGRLYDSTLVFERAVARVTASAQARARYRTPRKAKIPYVSTRKINARVRRILKAPARKKRKSHRKG